MLLPDYGPACKGPWSEQKDKDAFDGANRGARDNNASVTFRFRRTSIRVIGKTGPNGGFADIALDGQPQPQFDCYSPEVKRDAILFAKEVLPDGNAKRPSPSWAGMASRATRPRATLSGQPRSSPARRFRPRTSTRSRLDES